MDEIKWAKATEVYGRVQAEMLKSFLEAEGVPVELIQESAGESIFPTTVGMMGRVDVFVPNEKIEQARELIEAFNNPDNEIIDDDSLSEAADHEEPEV
jgi:hypothetical protein